MEYFYVAVISLITRNPIPSHSLYLAIVVSIICAADVPLPSTATPLDTVRNRVIILRLELMWERHFYREDREVPTASDILFINQNYLIVC